MHDVSGFIQDLASLMLVAGVVIIIFTRLKQPVVLGYIVAGFLIGPHFIKPGLIQDLDTIKTLSELGVIFLMFCLGLEFSIRKLFSVGTTAFLAAFLEIVTMVWVGREIGRFFNWSDMESLFLGVILAMSSTTIIVKALSDLKMKHERFAQLIFGTLIVEDILGIGIIALLSGLGYSQTLEASVIVTTVSKLTLFMVVSLVVGIIVVPRLLSYIASFENDEMMLVSVLGLCFGFCLLVLYLQYSIVLGAFLIGAIMAESRQLAQIERMIDPIRDMFSAIFFVAIGMLIKPEDLLTYHIEIIVIAVAVILGKLVSCGIGSFIAGNDGKTSMRVGMGLSQIGEFSFIIAALGCYTLKVVPESLYSIVVGVSVITTLTTPYSIKLADPLSRGLARIVPESVARVFNTYTEWVGNIRLHGDKAILATMIKRIIMQVSVNLALVIAIFLAAAFFIQPISIWLTTWVAHEDWKKAIICGGALLLSLPFLIAAYRKLKALSMLLAEMSLKGSNIKLQRIIAETIPVLSMVVTLVFIAALSSAILPTRDMLFTTLGVIAIITAVLWRWFVKVHTRLQIALFETLENSKDNGHNH